MTEIFLYETPHHVLSRCVFISKKFPRLLAEREIIANAFYYLPLKSYRRPLLGSNLSAVAASCHDDQPVLDCKSTKSFWISKRKSGENNKKVPKYLELIEILRIFAPSECRQRARKRFPPLAFVAIFFQAGPF